MEYITSKNNDTIKLISSLIKSSKARRREKLFVCEGLRICYDAYLSDSKIEITIISENALTKLNKKIELICSKSQKVYAVKDNIFSNLSDTKTPQGILCVIKALDKYSSFDKIIQNGKFLALEDIQDPNNLGTIFRTAEAFKVDCVLMTNGCCDIYSPKVVRGSMGAIFRQPFIICDNLSEVITDFNNYGVSYAAILNDNADRLNETVFDNNSLIVIGNEGNGIKASTVEACKKSIFIPMTGKAESLNAAVASSILVWEMMK